jgi:hypothetical protein
MHYKLKKHMAATCPGVVSLLVGFILLASSSAIAQNTAAVQPGTAAIVLTSTDLLNPSVPLTGIHNYEYHNLQDHGTDTEEPAPVYVNREGRFGVGFQSSYPAWGLSGTYDVNEDISAQAILGFFGNLQTYAGRGVYRFQQEEQWNLYGYGLLGIWRYSFSAFGISESESAVGFGLGAGLEYDWRAWNETLPPIYWNIELGLGIVDMDHYNFSTIMIGAGLHYRFGGN